MPLGLLHLSSRTVTLRFCWALQFCAGVAQGSDETLHVADVWTPVQLLNTRILHHVASPSGSQYLNSM